jgi:hypothetical protein
MKRIIYILTILIAFTLTSCGITDESKGRSAYKDYLSKNLKDPNSLIIYNEEVSKSGSQGLIFFYVDYGAKNELGGMGREKIKFETKDGVIWKVNDEFDVSYPDYK